MDISSLLAVVALALAVYSLLSPAKKLQLSLRTGFIEKTILVIGCFLIHLLVLCSRSPRSTSLYHELTGIAISPDISAYLVLLTTSLIAIWFFSRFRLSRSSIKRFRTLADTLHYSRDYSELVQLVEEHFHALLSLSTGHYFPEKLRRFLPPKNHFFDLERFEKRLARLLPWQRSCIEIIQPWLKRFNISNESFPTWSHAQIEAEGILQMLLSNPNFAHELARTKPYLALQVFSATGFFLPEFMDNYFQSLLNDRSSIFYLEIRNNQNLSIGEHRYRIPKENRLLHFLFNDTEKAHSLGIYKPIGESVLRHLDHLRQNIQADPYNDPPRDYQEDGRWGCPLFVGIQFFDIMLAEAIYQNIEWHMWLYYYPHFARRICRNVDFSNPDIDVDAEMPTKYLYLLHEMNWNLSRWVECLEDIPLSQSNSKLATSRPSHENGNPFKSSILALDQILHHIVRTKGMPQHFVHSQFDIVFYLYFDLLKIKGRANYAETIMNTMISGAGYVDRSSPDFLGTAIQAYCSHDHAKHMSQDYETPIVRLVTAFGEEFGYDELVAYVEVSRVGDKVRVSAPHGYNFEIPLKSQ
ncbi:MAG: hypothetical protein ABIJ96_01105 [Elusimicrobiota bacterium]